MGGQSYAAFVAFAMLLVVVPGPDFAVVLKNTLASGRRAGMVTSTGIACSNAVQGAAAAFGLGAVIVSSQALFQAIRWAGIAYLAFLGVQALRSALRSRASEPAGARTELRRDGAAWRQGFLSNVSNPKVLAFYLSVLPQFLDPASASTVGVLALALTHAALSLAWLLLVVVLLQVIRRWLERPVVRRAVDAATGVVLLAFAGRLAIERR